MQLLRSVSVLAHVVLFSWIAAQPSVAQEAAAKKPAKKVWTNDDLEHLSSPGRATTQATSPDTGNVDLPRNHYMRAKDPKWYVSQLGPLREEIAQIDRQLKIIAQTRKDGRGTTGAVALDQEPEGVSTDAQGVLLQKRRAVLVGKIDELESEARRNEVSPGALRSDFEPEKSEAGEAIDNSVPSEASEIAKVENSLRGAKEHLKRSRNELNLLQRGLDLEQREVYSNPDYLSRKTGDSRLTSIQGEMAGKDREIQETEQRIGQLEEHLEDLKLDRPAEAPSQKVDGNEGGGPGSGSCRQTEAAIACTVSEKAQEEKGESYWRKRFAEARYKIGIAENERDILQRELGVLLLQYYPNPAKAMRENVTRKEINEHRKAIEVKQREIEELGRALADLEDELRHAGGPPGWSRE
ncbi:MAG TPA: hypothetical protein VHE23_04710 [Candidatus Acidoferrales bacterium]|nr:hypothetical protein [Candidatus Acidoferrales bacterium]